MFLKQIIFTLLIIFLLPACSIKHPQTAEEFRQGVPTAFMGMSESYTVNRPYDKVVKTIKRKAPKCLNVRVTTTSQTTTSYQVIVTKYKPTVIAGKKKTELHIQQLHEQGVMNISEVPRGGYYLMVTDIVPAGKNKTKVTMYRPSMGIDTMVAAIKGWISGKNMGCPDLTKH
ncbi:MAG: hypothetical protein OEY43_08915 [Gammaproteobacteria bacterium]|nr:hypothetical protein [Gammaproteobacteria bacterium]